MGQVTFSLDAEVENTRKPNAAPSARRDTLHDIVEGGEDELEYERTQRLRMKEHLLGQLGGTCRRTRWTYCCFGTA